MTFIFTVSLPKVGKVQTGTAFINNDSAISSIIKIMLMTFIFIVSLPKVGKVQIGRVTVVGLNNLVFMIWKVRLTLL